MHIITFCSFKGGTGKTTLSLNISCCLAKCYNKKILLLDLDPQGNLTSSLGIQPAGLTSNHILNNEAGIKECVTQTKIKNLDLIPSSIFMEEFRNQDVIQHSIYSCALKEALSLEKDNYDICIIDTPPSLGNITKESFLASNHLVICLNPEPFAILGLQKIKEFNQLLPHNLKPNILGIVFSFWDERCSTNNTYTNIVNEVFPDKIMKSKIRKDIVFSRSLLKEDSVINVYPKSRASNDVMSLSKEILTKVSQSKNKVLF